MDLYTLIVSCFHANVYLAYLKVALDNENSHAWSNMGKYRRDLKIGKKNKNEVRVKVEGALKGAPPARQPMLPPSSTSPNTLSFPIR